MRTGDWTKKLGDACTRCKRTDVEFNRRSYACRACGKASWAEYRDANLDQLRVGTRDQYARRKAALSPEEHKAKLRASQLYVKYGLVPADVARMLVNQHGVCAICGRDEWGGRSREPDVDHDHTVAWARSHGRQNKTPLERQRVGERVHTGLPGAPRCAPGAPRTVQIRDTPEEKQLRRLSVRGLLCTPCNTMLGGARDSIQTLEKAIDYLKRAAVRRASGRGAADAE